MTTYKQRLLMQTSYEVNPEIFYGLTIADIEIIDNSIVIFFADTFSSKNKLLQIKDIGQQCCEKRFITCDDNFKTLIGENLVYIEVKDGPCTEDEDGRYDQQFLEITTNKDSATFVTHNIHNGYYGGFNIEFSTRYEKIDKPIKKSLLRRVMAIVNRNISKKENKLKLKILLLENKIEYLDIIIQNKLLLFERKLATIELEREKNEQK